MNQNSATKRGTCGTCLRPFTLTKAGLLRTHGSGDPSRWPPMNCAGSGYEPVQAAARPDTPNGGEAADHEHELTPDTGATSSGVRVRYCSVGDCLYREPLLSYQPTDGNSGVSV